MKAVNSPLLFEDSHLALNKNILPYDGEALYYGRMFKMEEAGAMFNALSTEIAWEHDEVMMFGKKIITKRKVAWYGDKPFDYTYSQVKKTALAWTATLTLIKQKIEDFSGESYNSCLLNLYHNGGESMGWHTDDEKELKKNGAIASVSLGADRKFSFKHKNTLEKIDIQLENGSLLVMKGTTQTHWLHQLPPSKRVGDARINLTFRTIVTPVH